MGKEEDMSCISCGVLGNSGEVGPASHRTGENGGEEIEDDEEIEAIVDIKVVEERE